MGSICEGSHRRHPRGRPSNIQHILASALRPVGPDLDVRRQPHLLYQENLYLGDTCGRVSEPNGNWILGSSSLHLTDPSPLNAYSGVGPCADDLLPGDKYPFDEESSTFGEVAVLFFPFHYCTERDRIT